MRTIVMALAWVALLGGVASAHEFKAGSVTIEHPWARPAASGNAAAYFGMANGGATADRLVGISSPAAAKAELHASTVDAQGVASMHQVQAVDVPAGGEAKLAPGGLHVMLIDLTGPLQEGQHFPLTLTFEQGGEVTVEVAVERRASHGDTTGAHQHAPAPSN